MSKTKFKPGDIVRLNKELDHVPRMMVSKVVFTHFSGSMDSVDNSKQLSGVECIWFSKDGSLQTYKFDTRDLEKDE